jgi:transcriptional regulator with XRE-family HTH domain
MPITLSRMTLPELLERYRVYTIRELSRRTGLSRQHAWNLWHGVAGVGKQTMGRLHARLGIPLEALMQVERAEPATPPQTTPARPPGRPRKRPFSATPPKDRQP